MGSGIPADAIIMGERDEIDVNAMTNRTRNGTEIDRFYCSTGYMLCKVFASRKYCTCEQGDPF